MWAKSRRRPRRTRAATPPARRGRSARSERWSASCTRSAAARRADVAVRGDRKRRAWRGRAVFEVHHALLDGQGGIALAQAMLDLEPARPRRAAKPAARTARRAAQPRPGPNRPRSTVRQFANLLRAVPATLKLAGGVQRGRGIIGSLRENVLSAPRTVFNRQVGPAPQLRHGCRCRSTRSSRSREGSASASTTW